MCHQTNIDIENSKNAPNYKFEKKCHTWRFLKALKSHKRFFVLTNGIQARNVLRSDQYIFSRFWPLKWYYFSKQSTTGAMDATNALRSKLNLIKVQRDYAYESDIDGITSKSDWALSQSSNRVASLQTISLTTKNCPLIWFSSSVFLNWQTCFLLLLPAFSIHLSKHTKDLF